MKRTLIHVRKVFLFIGLSFISHVSLAGVPFNNLEGVGGAAFNPFAYTAGQNKDRDSKDEKQGLSFKDVLSKPQFGVWYVNLGDVSVDWTAFGAAETFFDRLEVSYGFENIAPTGKNIHKNNVGTKLLLIKENFKDLPFVPALSVGSIWKNTSRVAEGVDSSAFDIYAVATKLITQLPRPVLLSAGLLSTSGLVTGVFGYDDDRDEVFFGNINVLPFSNIAVGFEYKQGAEFSTFNNADYWDIHVGWLANKNLSLILAYVNAGDDQAKDEVGLGEGVVLSAQYAF